VNWFNREVVRKVGNGENTRFWLDHWVGNEALCLTYPRLFLISSQKDATVGGVLGGECGRWILEFSLAEESFCVGRGSITKYPWGW